jgi:hypothetical protein
MFLRREHLAVLANISQILQTAMHITAAFWEN